MFGLTAQAQQSTPAITLTAEVDSMARELVFAATEPGHKLRIDWGDGKTVETEEIAVADDYGTTTAVYGTPVGNGEIKIYGEGIAQFEAVSRVDGTQITAIDVTGAKDLAELAINGNDIRAIDLSQNTKLAKLVCSNNSIETLDLSANPELTRLEAQNMKLASIDLSQNTKLTYLHLGNNLLTDIDITANTELGSIYLLNNQIGEIDLSQNKKLTYISLNNNLLTSIDATACENLASLFCMNNRLEEVKIGQVKTTVNLNGNRLTLATLPAATSRNFLYNQQEALQIAESVKVGETIDLSAQNHISGLAGTPQATAYTWITAQGDILAAGTDYTEEDGKFTFLNAQQDSVYCTMETPAFPAFTGTNPFKTTFVYVTDGSAIDTPAITLTAEVDSMARELVFAATEPGHKLRIDWGDGKTVETEEIAVADDYGTTTAVYGTPVGNGEIKIYGEGIAQFEAVSRVDGTQITAIDVTGAKDLAELAINGNDIRAIDLSQNTKLAKLVCSNNSIETLDLSANPELTRLEAQNMKLASIDLSQNTKLTYLHLGNNLLTDIDITANTELGSIYLLNNQIGEIDLSQNKKLTYISLNNNLLTSIDATACENLASLFCMNNRLEEVKIGQVKTTVNLNGNRLTLATLPAATSRNFLYNQQEALQIAESVKVGETIDLSAQNHISGLAGTPQATAYTWITAQGDILAAGTDYTEEDGKFTFLNAQQDSVYCTMETPAFPAFTGANPFKTTFVYVAKGTGVESLSKAQAPVIRGGKGFITVDHAPAGCTVALYDLSGCPIGTQTASGDRLTFNVKPGLYIISIDGTARKVGAF